MPTILLTGAAGLIGHAVAKNLLQSGRSVVAVDDLNDAYDPRLKERRLADIETSVAGSADRFHFFRADIGDRRVVENGFPEWQAVFGHFDGVINLAARAGIRASVADPWIYYQTNVLGTLNLLECCRRFEIPKFVLASSSSLYGANNPLPYREDANTDCPLSPYAASKKAAETLAYSYHHLHGIDVSILRYFTVYGPAGRPDMAVFRFVRRIAEGEPIVVFGDGSQSRDFTYVDDIARGTVAAMKAVGFETFNLGGDHPIALSELIARIGELVGREPVLEYRPVHPADATATWADISKAKDVLAWRPEVSVEEGLRRAVEWYRENREWAREVELGDR